MVITRQCCGSGRILTGSGSDFRKRPDPDPVPDPNPDPYKFSANFFLKIFLMKICFKKYLHEPKSETTEIPEVSLAFKHTKKVSYGHLLGPGSGSGSGSGPRCPDPDPDATKKVRIRPDPDPQQCH
jgi:hypothetical protein